MKRNIVLSAMLVICGMLFAQQAVITFKVTEHDFGKINEADGKVTTVFEFVNEGMEPLVLTNVRASCGCTTPSWTKTPVEPGQTGTINVTYNPNGRPGRFQKTITVTSNATEPSKKLFIKGEVIPKQAKPINKYPVKMGDLSVASKDVNFGTVLKGKSSLRQIEYANLSEQDITVDILYADGTPVEAQASLQNVKKGETGQFQIRYDAAKGNDFGPQELAVYVVVNGKRQLTDDYKINLIVNVEEDFSALTAEDKQKAPIAEFAAKSIEFGTITAGKRVKKSISLTNAGVNPLQVRRIINNSEDRVKVTGPKGAVKSGKKVAITAEIDGKVDGEPMKVGQYHRMITVMTNDPANPKVQISINWTIE